MVGLLYSTHYPGEQEASGDRLWIFTLQLLLPLRFTLVFVCLSPRPLNLDQTHGEYNPDCQEIIKACRLLYLDVNTSGLDE